MGTAVFIRLILGCHKIIQTGQQCSEAATQQVTFSQLIPSIESSLRGAIEPPPYSGNESLLFLKDISSLEICVFQGPPAEPFRSCTRTAELREKSLWNNLAGSSEMPNPMLLQTHPTQLPTPTFLTKSL